MISTYRYQATKVRKWFHPEDTSSSFLVIWKIFFPPWNSDECEDLLFNVRIILGLSPCDRQNSHGDILQGHSLRISVFKVFQGPSFSLFLFNSWVVQNHTETATEGSKDGLLHYVQEIGYFQSSSWSSQSRNYHFQRCLAFPQNR